MFSNRNITFVNFSSLASLPPHTSTFPHIIKTWGQQLVLKVVKVHLNYILYHMTELGRHMWPGIYCVCQHCLILVKDKLYAQFFFLYVYFNSLHVSSNLLLIIRRITCINTTSGMLCRWLSSMQVRKFLPDLHSRLSPTQSDTYQMLYWYNWLSWWWAQGCSKHVENWNKHIEKRIVHQVGHLQELYWDARSTEHKNGV
jgi:hypothetical protein